MDNDGKQSLAEPIRDKGLLERSRKRAELIETALASLPAYGMEDEDDDNASDEGTNFAPSDFDMDADEVGEKNKAVTKKKVVKRNQQASAKMIGKKKKAQETDEDDDGNDNEETREGGEEEEGEAEGEEEARQVGPKKASSQTKKSAQKAADEEGEVVEEEDDVDHHEDDGDEINVIIDDGANKHKTSKGTYSQVVVGQVELFLDD